MSRRNQEAIPLNDFMTRPDDSVGFKVWICSVEDCEGVATFGNSTTHDGIIWYCTPHSLELTIDDLTRRCKVRGCANAARSAESPLLASEYCGDHFMPVAVRYRCFHEGSVMLAPEVATIERQLALRRFARTYDCEECTPDAGEGLA